MTKLCYAFLKYENELKIELKKVVHSFEVHSNASTCRKNGCPGLEQVNKNKHLVRCIYQLTIEIVHEIT